MANKSSMHTDAYEKVVTESATPSQDSDEEKPSVHLLSFRDPDGCPLYDQIVAGRKTVEGRKNSPTYQKIKVGDILLMSDRKKGILECEVTYVKLYVDVSEYIASEGVGAVFGDPVKCRNISSVAEGLKIYKEFVPEKQIKELSQQYGHGFMGIGINFLHEYKRYFETLNEPWFSAIRDGLKIAEGRLNKSWVQTLKKLDMIEFTRVPPKGEENSLPQKIEVIVTDLKSYKKFTDLFDDIGLDKVLPGKKTYEDGVAVYRQWYSEEKENELGVVGIFVKVIRK